MDSKGKYGFHRTRLVPGLWLHINISCSWDSSTCSADKKRAGILPSVKSVCPLRADFLVGYAGLNIIVSVIPRWGWVLGEEAMIRSVTVLGFNNMSTLVGHFVLSPREREKRDRRDSRGDERDRLGRKRNGNESGETPSALTCYKDSRPCPTVKPISVGRHSDVKDTTPSQHRPPQWVGASVFIYFKSPVP